MNLSYAVIMPSSLNFSVEHLIEHRPPRQQLQVCSSGPSSSVTFQPLATSIPSSDTDFSTLFIHGLPCVRSKSPAFMQAFVASKNEYSEDRAQIALEDVPGSSRELIMPSAVLSDTCPVDQQNTMTSSKLSTTTCHPVVCLAGPTPQTQSYFDVLLPHVQMASANPFIMGLSDNDVCNNQHKLWSQQWIELIQQSGCRQFASDDIDQEEHEVLTNTASPDDWHFVSRNEICETTAGLFLQPFRKNKRIRTAFSPQQLVQLEKAFEVNHYVIGNERKELASRLSLTETQVKVWFQNRRTKHKRVKSDSEKATSPERVK